MADDNLTRETLWRTLKTDEERYHCCIADPGELNHGYVQLIAIV